MIPRYCLLDETDSGLDIDALKVVAKGVNSMRSKNRGFLVITHYQRLLDYIKPDHVHVMADGKIVKSGGAELALELEEKRIRLPQNCLTLFKMNSETATVKQVAFEKDDVGNFSFPESHKFDAGYGLTKDTVDYISKVKDEPAWVNEFRHKALETFESKPMPTNWATRDLENIDFDAIRYYLSDGAQPKRSWDEVPPEVLETFDRLGVPEQERAFLAGVEAQYDSEAAYSNVKEALADEGVIFVTCAEGLKEHEEIFRPWFGKVIPTGDNKFSALNSAVMSGGSFIYIPPGVKVKHPLQAYFRINSENFGQFERTLIIADEGSEVMYMEGCTAPKFETATLHSAVVELVAMKGAKIQYITVQNWSSNVFNLVTKRGLAHEDAEIPMD